MPRLIFAKLVDKAGSLPMPDRAGRLFDKAGEWIDADAPFWMTCLNDGSIKEANPPSDAEEPQTTPDAPAGASNLSKGK